jgi:hypothetical protein
MNEIKTILTMVQELHNNQQRGRLAGLTEDSAILIDTADIAEMMNYSYSYTYNKIVCRPDFPAPIDPEKRPRSSGKKNRRWIAGDVVKYIKSCRQQ